MKKIKLISAIPILILPVILFSPTIFSGRALFWGTPSAQFIPWWEYAWNTLLSGEIPLWNPWVGMGSPLIANYQSAIFYPPYWIHLLFFAAGGSTWMAWSITLVVVLHLILAGFGTAQLLKELGVSTFGQTIGAISFLMSGYLVARAGFLSINATTAWIPWILLFSMKLAKGENKYLWYSGIVLSVQFLAGHAQSAWYTVLLLGFWYSFWSIIRYRVERDLFGLFLSWGKLLASGFLSIGISAIQLLPTLEYLLQSQRSSEFGYTEAMTYSFWPWRFLTLFVPNLFGDPGTGNYWGYGNYYEDSVYMGLLPLMLVIGIIFKARSWKGLTKNNKGIQPRTQQALVYFLFSIIILSFLLALGNNTKLFPYLYNNVPTFDLFQAPTRFTIWAVISMAILTGIGIDNLSPPAGKNLYVTRLAAAGCLAISVGALLAAVFLPDIETTFIASIGKTGLMGLALVLAVLLMPENEHEIRQSTWQWIVVCLVAVDLLVAGWRLNPGIELSFYQVGDPDIKRSRVFMYDDLEYDLKFNRFFKFDTFTPEEDWIKMKLHLLPNLNMLSRVEMVNNFDPMVPGRYQTWIDRINATELLDNQQLLDLMNIGKILSLSEKGELITDDVITGEKDLISLIPCALSMKDDTDILNTIIDGTIDLEEYLIIEREWVEANENCSVNMGIYSIVQSNSQSLTVTTNLDKDGWVFWSQTWYPGWKGNIDGQPVKVEKGNYLFQAIYATKGQHTIKFEYKPDVFYLGFSVSILSSMVLVTGLLLSKRRKI